MEDTSTAGWNLGTWLAVIVPILVTVGVMMLFLLRRRNPLLTYVEQMVLDRSGRFLHIFGAERIMPEDGDSFDIWHHRLLDLQALAFHQGEKQRGNNLELDSPFVSRSMQKLSQELRTPLELGVVALETDDDHSDSEWEEAENQETWRMPVSHPELVLIDGNESDTVKPKRLPTDCITLTKLESEPARFSLAQFRNGREAFSLAIKGDCEYFAKVSWIPNKPWMAMTYRRTFPVRSGMALLIYDYERGEMVMDEFIKALKRGK